MNAMTLQPSKAQHKSGNVTQSYGSSISASLIGRHLSTFSRLNGHYDRHRNMLCLKKVVALRCILLYTVMPQNLTLSIIKFFLKA